MCSMGVSNTFDCYVNNLPLNYTESDVRELFGVAGEIVGVKILPAKDFADGKVAFVKFTDESDAHCCAQYLNNHKFEDGQVLKVRYRPKSEEQKNGYSGSLLNTAYKSEEDELERVFISHVETPVEFWAQNCSEIFLLQLKELIETLEELCPHQPKVMGQLSTDTVYACKFTEDNRWYRCVIEKALSKNEMHVRYIDYGNSEDVNKSCLVTLPNNLATLPSLCHRYLCEGLELTTTDVNSEVYEKGLDEFIELVNEERVVLKVIEKNSTSHGNEITIVKIHKDENGKLLDIPTKMIATGAVRKKIGNVTHASFATAVKAPLSKPSSTAPTPPIDTFPNANPYASIVTNGCEPSLKSAFNQLIHDTSFGQSSSSRSINPIKRPESPARPLFSPKFDTPRKKAHDWFSDPMETTPFSNSPLFDLDYSNTNGKETMELFNDRSPSRSSHRRLSERESGSSITTEFYRSKIESSARIIEKLKRQLAEKSNVIENYQQINSRKPGNGFHPPDKNPTPASSESNDKSTSERRESKQSSVTSEATTETSDECESEDDVTSNNDDTVENIDALFKVPSVTWEDVGGYGKEMSNVKSVLNLALHHGELFKEIGVETLRGVIITGPSGVGKTLIARAVANDSEVYMREVNGPDLLSGSIEEANDKLEKVFRLVTENTPSILILDQLDVIAPRHKHGKNKMVAKLLSLIKTLEQNSVVISTALREDNVDPILKTGGLYAKEIPIAKPDVSTRLQILNIITHRKLNFSKGVCLTRVAEETRDYVAANLMTLCMCAVAHALRSKMTGLETLDKSVPTEEKLQELSLNMADFKNALKSMKSLLDETMATIPTTAWDDIYGNDSIKNELRTLIRRPASHKSSRKEMKDGVPEGATIPDGVPPEGLLFCAPRGFGKSMLTKALCNACNCKFIAVKGYELCSANQNTQKRHVAEIFDNARINSPCVLYVDEIEHIGQVNDILRELDDRRNKKIHIIGGTCRPSLINPSLRSRFQHFINLPFPNIQVRLDILRNEVRRKRKCEIEVEDHLLEKLAEQLHGFTPADLQRIVTTVYNISSEGEKITGAHFDVVLRTVRRTITDGDVEECVKFIRKFEPIKPFYTVSSYESQDNENNEEIVYEKSAENDKPAVGEVAASEGSSGYVVLLGLFTIACFIYIIGFYLFTTLKT